MTRHGRYVVAAMVLLGTACSNQLGVGLPECEEVPRRPTPAMILSLQAVPSAEFAPCIDDIPLGWDEVEFSVRSGRAEVRFLSGLSTFLTVSLEPTCAVPASAVPGPSPQLSIERHDAIDEHVEATLSVVIVPTATRPEVMAGAIASRLAGTEVEGRLVEFTIDRNMDQDILSRVNFSFLDADFVWIIDELGAAEDTVRVRRSSTEEIGQGVSTDRALDLMEDYVDEPAFVGDWFYTFVGGCITYSFEAGGAIAENIEEDVRSAIGFYDLDALRELGRRNGINLEQAPPPNEQ